MRNFIIFVLISVFAVALTLSDRAQASQDLESGIYTGSGVFISSDGYMVTADHVVSGAKKIVISWQGKRCPAKIVQTEITGQKYFHPENDVALLKVDCGVPVNFVSLAEETRNIEAGSVLYTSGFPLAEDPGEAPSFSKGYVSRNSSTPHSFEAHLLVMPGSSGSGVLNDKGELVGIVSAHVLGAPNWSIIQRVEYVKFMLRDSRVQLPKKSWIDKHILYLFKDISKESRLSTAMVVVEK